MLNWIKRFFGLNYHEATATKHSGIGYSGISSPAVEDVIMVTPSAEISTATALEEKPVKEKKLRKPAVKKASPKRTSRKK